ncbi:MAG: hypothetical protein RJQ09_04065 [Cyclobacteriaceae bacterium]
MKSIKLIVIVVLLSSCQQQDESLIGAWQPQRYILQNGSTVDVDGHIFFSQSEWSVVFFTVDENGDVLNGSAEGGDYALDGNRLTFRHKYNMSDIDKGNSTQLRKELKKSSGEYTEETCKIEIKEGVLAIYFPSGNAMIFAKRD